MSHATYAYDQVAILRPGRYTAEDGRPVELTAADLAELAAQYDPGWHAAPLNLDHAAAGPSLGRITALSFDGEYLRADLQGVPPELADQLAAGAYPSRSAELYPAQDGHGPQLRGLALLGARPPAVKGLPPLPPGRREPLPDMDATATSQTGAADHLQRTMHLGRAAIATARQISLQGVHDVRETSSETV